MSYTPSPYEQARLDKIKRNNNRLKELGLLDAKKRVRRSAATAVGKKKGPSTPTKCRPRRASAATAVTPSPRSSRRLKRQTVQYEPLMDDDESLRIVRKKFREVKRQTKKKVNAGFKCDIPDASSSPLTKKQQDIIEKKMEGDFVGKFEEYLINVDTLSDQNRRNVLRQVTKLATGEGIRYESKAYGWPEGCYFLKGTEVGPADDVLKLMDVGRECEDEWGRDHGNGWLLSHPLKKLYMFQQYHLQD